MLFYYSRRFEAAAVGTRVVEVACERCGCEYFYQLARLGSGSASAPYAIGSASAERSARQGAQQDLDERLTEEAELVPCPACRWINEGLVDGYRRGRWRHASEYAAAIAFFGTVASLIGGWFLSAGPAADRGAVPYLLHGGPTVSITLAGAILLVRHLIRARIRPNRDYPLPPRLPRGSPAALVRNAATGELEPAVPDSEARFGDPNPAWVDFQVGRDLLPPVCCACLAPAEPGSEYRRPAFNAVDLLIPLCSPCARRWTRHAWLGASAGLGLAAAIGIPVLLWMNPDEVIFWMTIVVLGIVAPIVGAMVIGYMTEPIRVQLGDSTRGVLRLWFRNEEFARRVAEGLPTAPDHPGTALKPGATSSALSSRIG